MNEITEMTREQYLRWAKERAFAHIRNNDPIMALGLFVRDLRGHPELSKHEGIHATMKMLMSGRNIPLQDVKKWIENFGESGEIS